MNKLDFAIIAAGEGSRLKEKGITVSKPMVKLDGTPLIERLLTIAEKLGFNSVSCIINEESPDVEEYLEKREMKLPFRLVKKSTPSSMHSLFELGSMLGDNPFILTTVDTIFREDDFTEYVEYCRNNDEYAGILGVTEFVDDEKPLCVRLGEGNRIAGFDDKYEGHKYITAGFYYFRPEIFNEKETALNRGIERLRNFQRLLVEKGYDLRAYSFKKVIDVDTPHDIKIALEFLRNN